MPDCDLYWWFCSFITCISITFRPFQVQQADLAFESWGVTSSALRYVWLGAILGFPIALIFGWRYDFTTKGIVRTPPTDAGTQIDISLHRSDYVILSLPHSDGSALSNIRPGGKINP